MRFQRPHIGRLLLVNGGTVKMNETMEMLLQKDVSDSIVDRIHETRHRIAAYFGNDFMRMARFGAGELDLPPDFFISSPNDSKLAPAMA